MLYLWAAKEFGWSTDTIDSMDLDLFIDMYVLYDKVNNPDEYLPGEYYFHS